LWYSGSAKIIFETHNVVFAEIISSLDFDKDQVFVAGVLHSMCGADGNIDRFAGADRDIAAVERDSRRSFNDHPVLGALRVFLITQPLARLHLDALDLERAPFFEHGISAPGPLIEFSQLVWSLRKNGKSVFTMSS